MVTNVERAVRVHGDNHRDYHTDIIFGTLVELLRKGHDVDAMLTETPDQQAAPALLFRQVSAA